MKHSISIIAFFALGAGSVLSQEKGELEISGSSVGMLPSEKKATTLLAGERNPFAIRVANVESKVSSDLETESARVERVLKSLTISGIAPGPQGMKALLGDIILEEGRMVDPVIENQTDKVQVTKITNKKVELTWLSDDEAESPRVLELPVDLKVTVRRRLAGEQGAGKRKMYERGATRPLLAEEVTPDDVMSHFAPQFK